MFSVYFQTQDTFASVGRRLARLRAPQQTTPTSQQKAALARPTLPLACAPSGISAPRTPATPCLARADFTATRKVSVFDY